jgi:hypothetical protein
MDVHVKNLRDYDCESFGFSAHMKSYFVLQRTLKKQYVRARLYELLNVEYFGERDCRLQNVVLMGYDANNRRAD